MIQLGDYYALCTPDGKLECADLFRNRSEALQTLVYLFPEARKIQVRRFSIQAEEVSE